jgi:hypothetical protein
MSTDELYVQLNYGTRRGLAGAAMACEDARCCGWLLPGGERRPRSLDRSQGGVGIAPLQLVAKLVAKPAQLANPSVIMCECPSHSCNRDRFACAVVTVSR